LKTLKKLPCDFHYRYECQTEAGSAEFRHKIVDWEAGALYWNVHRRDDWQNAFRQKFLTESSDREVLFSVLYAPRLPDALVRQQPLF